jgi:hypothetical protein
MGVPLSVLGSVILSLAFAVPVPAQREIPPVAARPAKRRDAAFGGDPRTRDHEQPTPALE